MSENKLTANSSLHELVSLYVLGALDAEEKAVFEEHLHQGCDAGANDLRSFGDVVSAIGESVVATPPARLRERLLSKVGNAPRVPGVLLQQSGFLISRSDELAWQTVAPGLAYKPLYEDATHGYNAYLVRMDAGVRYPSHRHAEVEELFLLSGDLHLEGQVMRAGDYCRADASTIHGETFTDTGCLFLLMASQHNQVL